MKCATCNRTDVPMNGKYKCKECHNSQTLARYHLKKNDPDFKLKLAEYQAKRQLKIDILAAPAVKYKICPSCKTNKEADLFPKNKRAADGLHTYCKLCDNVRKRANYAKDPEHHCAIAIKSYNTAKSKGKVGKQSQAQKRYNDKNNLYQVLFLSDTYVNKTLGLPVDNPLTDVKRDHLELNRVINEKRN